MEALRTIVLADLERGMRMMVRVQDELDPQFRFATPDGDVVLAVSFPASLAAREAMFERIRWFAAYKQALACSMTFNVAEPHALMTVGLSRSGTIACMSRIEGDSAYSEQSFASPVWVSREDIGEDIRNLLPRGSLTLSSDDVEEQEDFFGEDGIFPAVHLGTGAIGL